MIVPSFFYWNEHFIKPSSWHWFKLSFACYGALDSAESEATGLKPNGRRKVKYRFSSFHRKIKETTFYTAFTTLIFGVIHSVTKCAQSFLPNMSSSFAVSASSPWEPIFISFQKSLIYYKTKCSTFPSKSDLPRNFRHDPVLWDASFCMFTQARPHAHWSFESLMLLLWRKKKKITSRWQKCSITFFKAGEVIHRWQRKLQLCTERVS